MVLKEIDKRNRTAAWMPVLSDAIAVGALFLLLPLINQQTNLSSGMNVLFLVVFYLLFCIGVFLIRKLKTPDGIVGWKPPAFLLDRRVRAALAVAFALVMMTILAYQLGYFTSIQAVGSFELGEGESSSLFVYMPGALLGFSMLYVLVLAFPVEESVAEGSGKAAGFALGGTLLMNSLFLVLVLQLHRALLELGFSGNGAIFLLAIGGLLFSFTPPRLILQSKYPLGWALLSFAVLLLSGAFLLTF